MRESDKKATSQILMLAQQLDVPLHAPQAKKMSDYLALLVKWNQAYNLTAIRDLGAMLTLHVADSLSIAPYITGQHILDIGTGAGLPGLILAITFPEKQFYLLDSVGKKIRFLRHVIATLQINNVTLIEQRVESYSAARQFDVIMARAVATLKELYQLSHHLCHAEGYFLLQKGAYPTAELAELTCPYEVIELTVPGLEASRHVVRMTKGESHD